MSYRNVLIHLMDTEEKEPKLREAEFQDSKNIQWFLASMCFWAALLNLINYSQMTSNSSQIAYLNALLLDTSPASIHFSTVYFISKLILLKKALLFFLGLPAVLRKWWFYYSSKPIYMLLTLQRIQCLTMKLFFLLFWSILYDNA